MEVLIADTLPAGRAESTGPDTGWEALATEHVATHSGDEARTSIAD